MSTGLLAAAAQLTTYGTAAAYHEIGHAIASAMLGVPFRRVMVFDAEAGQVDGWDGRFHHLKTADGVYRTMLAASAGGFAEAFYWRSSYTLAPSLLSPSDREAVARCRILLAAEHPDVIVPDHPPEFIVGSLFMVSGVHRAVAAGAKLLAHHCELTEANVQSLLAECGVGPYPLPPLERRVTSEAFMGAGI